MTHSQNSRTMTWHESTRDRLSAIAGILAGVLAALAANAMLH